MDEENITFELGVPAQAVHKLKTQLESPDNIFQQLDITRIVLRRKDNLHTIFHELRNTYRDVKAEHQCVLFEKGKRFPHKISLRNTPQIVSRDDARQVFGLTDKWGLPTPIPNQYEEQGDVIFDHATGLIWQTSGSTDRLTYQGAQRYIEYLNRERFAGYDDWRLPTIPELMSLLEPERPEKHELYMAPIFDSRQSWCWSADTCLTGSHSSSGAWNINFRSGRINLGYLDRKGYVRAVRS
jgi:hypothetical protein